MHDYADLTLARAHRTLEERLRPAIHSHPHPLMIHAYRVGGEPIPVAQALQATYEPAAVGDSWGRAWDTTWFHVTGEIPVDFAQERVEALIDLGFDVNMTGFQAEGLAYRPDGSPVRSLHPRAQWLPVVRKAVGGEPVDFYIEAASNPVVLDYHPFLPTDKGEWDTAGEELLYRLTRVDLVVVETEVFELVHDVEVLLQLAEQLPDSSTRRAHILRALDRALDRIDLADIAGHATAARAELAEVLGSSASATSHRVTAVGHAHIDSAWLWPLRETVRKVARTTMSMVALIDEHPEFVYAMSSAQQYAWIKQQRPEVYAQVKRAVAEGRFVPVGGMWVEADAVLPGGESLIRQIAYGQRFFREEFGVECHGAWLPDSFGYSTSLPQILTGAGFDWFLSQKMSWNERNAFPYHTLLWEGLDGSRIFTHFPPMETYNSQLSGGELAHAERQFGEKDEATVSLAPTGWGDGGGGTTREMVARAARLADLEGSPRVAWQTPDEFFAQAKAELPDPPVWRGELYLERHRATYTTQHLMKQGNRRNEGLLRQAELWSATAAIRVGHPYPYDRIDQAWREVLLLQFHDILPGSAIAWVHKEAAERHARVTSELEAIIAEALAALGVSDTQSDGPTVLINAAPVTRQGVAPAAIGQPEPALPRTMGRLGDDFVVESAFVRFQFNAAGLMTSAVDVVSGREAIPAGTVGNLPQLHGDFPHVWDAWDVDAAYRGMRQDLTSAESVRIEDDALVVVRRFGDSTLSQRLSLAADARTLLIDNTIDWRATEKFLKLAFPVDVFADTAVAESQYGFQARPTHTNTSWDRARFETHTQKWFLVEEPGFGVAFLNDSTPGFDVTRVEIGGRITQLARFSMLRAPRFPDPHTDQGIQTMRFGLLLGADTASATADGWLINIPARVGHGRPMGALVTSSHPSVLVSTVKLADDQSGDLIVRVYESQGARAHTRVSVDGRVASAHHTDLIERSGAPMEVTRTDQSANVELDLRPFEVTTIRFVRS
ncbi:MAG: glycosyl hydrolase-related protein [Propionibacteriaceae bacterium]|jgi:alpha-mannosidase|nr:glycosyl hydrolase-related protein [Propionibacteriaceae bacterium]